MVELQQRQQCTLVKHSQGALACCPLEQQAVNDGRTVTLGAAQGPRGGGGRQTDRQTQKDMSAASVWHICRHMPVGPTNSRLCLKSNTRAPLPPPVAFVYTVAHTHTCIARCLTPASYAACSPASSPSNSAEPTAYP